MPAMVSITSLRTFGSAGWARRTSTRALGERAHVAAARERALVDHPSFGMNRERIGEDQRSAALGRGVMHCDGDDAAQRQPADMRAIDSELAHRGEDRGGIIVAGSVFGRGVAVAVAGIVERDRAARMPEMDQLAKPYRAVRSDPVEEDYRGIHALAGFVVADRLSPR